MVDDLSNRSGDEAPVRSRTPALVWLALIATVLAGSAAIAMADQAPSDGARNRAETYLPADGSAVLLEYGDGSSWIVESAYATGVRFLLQQPSLAGEHQLTRFATLGQDPSQARFFRETWADVAGDSAQITALYQLDADGVRLLTISGGPNGFSFDPGVLVLPADVASGSTWSSEGDALPQDLYTYESRGSAVAGDDGCLVVDLELNYSDPVAGQQVLATTQTTTWCPGIGVTQETFSSNGEPGSTRSTPFEQRTLQASSTALRPDLSGYATWAAAPLPMVLRDPLFGDSTLPGTTDATAVVLASGIAAFNTGSDVVAYRLGESEAVRSWIARPGGDIVRMAALGDVLLVGTTERRVRAYDSLGRRGWTAEFSDVLGATPVADGAGGAVLVALDGEVRRLRLDNGEQLWSVSLGADTELTPAVADGAVYAVDRSGTLHALSLDDGSTLWTANVTKPAAVAATSDTVFVITDDGGLYTWDASTGALGWWDSIPGIPDALVAQPDRVVVQGTEGTQAYEPDGTRLWTSPASGGLLTDGNLFVVLESEFAVLLDSDGTELGRWPVDREDLSFTRYLVAVAGGFWLVNTNFEVLAVTE